MLHRPKFMPPAIRPLLDNLDAALGACAELLVTSNPHALLRLELTAIAHVLQARQHMRDLRPADGAVTSQITLFLTVTDCLEEKASASSQTVGLEGAANRLIAGQIPLGTLMALSVATCDVLELCCATIDEQEAGASRQSAPILEAQVWATGPEAG
jgi:hypothetical protein